MVKSSISLFCFPYYYTFESPGYNVPIKHFAHPLLCGCGFTFRCIHSIRALIHTLSNRQPFLPPKQNLADTGSNPCQQYDHAQPDGDHRPFLSRLNNVLRMVGII